VILTKNDGGVDDGSHLVRLCFPLDHWYYSWHRVHLRHVYNDPPIETRG
jgi:hypothetical protein